MLLELLEKEVVAPSAHDRELAQKSSTQLDHRILSLNDIQMHIVDENGATEVLSIPAPALRLFSKILREMGKGNALTLIPVYAELTTNQAADILNVSRPYLIRLLEVGKIPYHRVGTHRRIFFKDLHAYKEEAKDRARIALQNLADDAQEWDMGY